MKGDEVDLAKADMFKAIASLFVELRLLVVDARVALEDEVKDRKRRRP